MDENYLGNYTMTKHQHLRLLKTRAINLQPWYLRALQYILHILHHRSLFPPAPLAQRRSFTALPKTITPPKATWAFKVYGREWTIQHFQRAAHVWHRGGVGAGGESVSLPETCCCFRGYCGVDLWSEPASPNTNLFHRRDKDAQLKTAAWRRNFNSPKSFDDSPVPTRRDI